MEDFGNFYPHVHHYDLCIAEALILVRRDASDTNTGGRGERC